MFVQIAENAAKYCGENSAACMRDKDGKYFSIGDINDRITIQAGEPVLHYDNGSYHTSVHFKCASIKSVHGMYYVNIKNIFEKVLSV